MNKTAKGLSAAALAVFLLGSQAAEAETCIANVCTQTGRLPGGTYTNNNGRITTPPGLPSDAYVIGPQGTRQPLAPQRPLQPANPFYPPAEVAPQRASNVCHVTLNTGRTLIPSVDIKFEPAKIRMLQKHFGLPASGKCDSATERAIEVGVLNKTIAVEDTRDGITLVIQ